MRHRSAHLLAVTFTCLTLFLAGCGASSSRGSAVAPHTVVIAPKSGLFSPYIVTVQPHDTVIWQSHDAIAHSITTTTLTSQFLNPMPLALTIPENGSVSMTFATPGVYDYYDPQMATWNATDQSVAAKSGVPAYPLAMEGIVYVQGPIAGLPKTATNTIPLQKDLFAHEFVAIAAGGMLSWHNEDEDLHYVSLVSGWSAPINPMLFDPIPLGGTMQDPPDGDTESVTFTQPGLYYYYCAVHAVTNPATSRAEAVTADPVQDRMRASEYPIPMAGFVLVAAT